MNTLFYGDNLTIMRKMPAESVDLIYLDPPFNSNRSYNLLYKNTTGLPIPEQIEAFCDTWELDYEKSEMAKDIPLIMHDYGIHHEVVQFWYYLVQALKTTNPRLLAYLVYMTIRLIEMHRLLKPTGSLYLHCDPTASHYLKIVMDSVFGPKHIRNEIIWHYKRYTARSGQFQKLHDVLFWYSKTNTYVFNDIREAYGAKSGIHDSHYKQDENGKWFRWQKRKGAEPYKIYLSEGRRMGDVWEIPFINASSKERLGYPTQKPLALLERIIQASSKENDLVFDPFCGCGTTIEAAIKNHRQWIGCDIAIHSIKLIQTTRIQKYGFTEHVEYRIEGIPQSPEQAQYLFEQDPFQFQYWAVEKTGGFCSHKKTGDKGIDGRLYFETGTALCSMVLSVKGGTIKPADIRDLRGVLEREKGTELAGFICLKEPTKAMKQEADAAGVYVYQGLSYPRIQILTIQDIFNGKTWYCPSMVKTLRKDTGQTFLAL
ncbi:MAG: site-specific DNA-methyltransferase [Treponema sp.]|jgi:site-specific DNA-methyltransferase (adenine-specific)|nr:site-specific DNA-methyltransferase [Treponema sp.]